MYVYIHTYIHTYIHAYIHTYIHTYVRTYVRTYVHTYIRTYTHLLAVVPLVLLIVGPLLKIMLLMVVVVLLCVAGMIVAIMMEITAQREFIETQLRSWQTGNEPRERSDCIADRMIVTLINPKPDSTKIQHETSQA